MQVKRVFFDPEILEYRMNLTRPVVVGVFPFAAAFEGKLYFTKERQVKNEDVMIGAQIRSILYNCDIFESCSILAPDLACTWCVANGTEGKVLASWVATFQNYSTTAGTKCRINFTNARQCPAYLSGSRFMLHSMVSFSL